MIFNMNIYLDENRNTYESEKVVREQLVLQHSIMKQPFSDTVMAMNIPSNLLAVLTSFGPSCVWRPCSIEGAMASRSACCSSSSCSSRTPDNRVDAPLRGEHGLLFYAADKTFRKKIVYLCNFIDIVSRKC